MKRVLSVGDICVIDDNSGDQRNENNSAVLTQGKRRQNKKSKKSDLSTVQTRQSATVAGDASQPEKSEQADVIGSIANGEVPGSLVNQLQKTVEELTEVVHAQQATINNLTNKLNFVLSFLDIHDDTCVDKTGGTTVSSAPDHSTVPENELNEPTGHSSAPDRASYSSVAAVGVNGRRNVTSQPVNFREAVAVAMCADRRDKERRAKSVIVSGLVPRHDVTDAVSFSHLCTQELGFDPVIVHTRRLGAANGDRVQPLLVNLQSSDDVSFITNHAKLLRQSDVEYVRKNVYINQNLTKVEARLAYEERCRRRLRQQVSRQRSSTQRQDDRQQARLQPSLRSMDVESSNDDNQRQAPVDNSRSPTDRPALVSSHTQSSMSSPDATAAGRHR